MKIFSILLFTFLLAGCSGSNCATAPAETMNIGGHSNLAMHIHPSVNILYDGKPIPVPPLLGLQQNIMRPIHTHDATGKLHVEAPCIRQFTLGEFFDIWGIEHGACFMEYCDVDISATVDGKAVLDYNEIILKDHMNIQISLTS